MFLYGSFDNVKAPAGSFNLKKIDTELGPLVTTNPGREKDVTVESSLRTGMNVNTAYYTENVEYLKELVEEVFEKSSISAGDAERFDEYLERQPPLGVQLYFDQKQIRGLDHYTGSPLQLRKPPSWFTRFNERNRQRFKDHPVVIELFSTPWPYLALLVLLGMGVRRIRLKMRTARKLIPDAKQHDSAAL
jgi:hypothetical protein